MNWRFQFFVMILNTTLAFSKIPDRFQQLVNQGEYTSAQQSMRQYLASEPSLSIESKLAIQFEIERLDRIRKDFTKIKTEVISNIKQYLPDVTDADIERWEQARSLEYKIIDGQKRYFNWAANNLFRIDSEAKAAKTKLQSTSNSDQTYYTRTNYVTQLIERYQTNQQIMPQRFQITYTLAVNPDAVPTGRTIRCWLPYPLEIANRQTDIQLLNTTPARHIISDNHDYLQRSVYLENIATKGTPTKFQVSFAYTNYPAYVPIDAAKVRPATITADLEPFIAERPPHIFFTPEMRQLGKEIVGSETNPYRIAQLLFAWVDQHIPWASAREYSTFQNISEYVRVNRHADCGMQTIFFMTLCRMYDIPTRWQSGWRTEPDEENMHDWGEIYFEPYGWVPVDVTNGLLQSSNPQVKWFFLSGMDAYRLIVNDDYSQQLYPAKMYFRSETLDFQRGEVEWEGGNIYFDQWDYEFAVKRVSGK
ncbi:transglutaminase domain-containing protein [candidate division KSB1 bacterium]|nr:transglutaminase domain-containing protein [candidate division KSB1 bacterium]